MIEPLPLLGHVKSSRDKSVTTLCSLYKGKFYVSEPLPLLGHVKLSQDMKGVVGWAQNLP